MKGLNIIIVLSVIAFFSFDAHGQEKKERSMKVVQKKINKNTKAGTSKKYYDEANKESKVSATEKSCVEKSLEKTIVQTSPPKSKDLYFHTAKKISKETGFFIELVISTEVLDKEHKIYQEFGKLMVQKDKNQNFSYLIGTFATKEAADNFLKKFILKRYVDAKVIKLNEGSRE